MHFQILPLSAACVLSPLRTVQGLEEERAVKRTGARLSLRGDRVVLPPPRRAKEE